MTRSRAIFAFALTAGMMGALAACAQPEGPSGGQQGGRGPRMGRGPGENGSAGLHLLTNDQVQKDLALTDEQRVQILTLTMEARRNRGMNIGPQLAEILTPKQLQRLKQIRLQVEGPAALVKPEMVAALELSKEQCAKLKALQEEVREKVRQVTAGVGDLPNEERLTRLPGILEKLEEIRKQITAKALEVLTPQQRQKFDEMQGVKLNLDLRQPAKPAEQTPPAKSEAEPPAKADAAKK